MDRDAFYAGYAEALSKNAGITDWARETFGQPLAQGFIDGHYSGLGRYNTSTGSIDPHTRNALRMVAGNTPESVGVTGHSSIPYMDSLRKGLYQFSSSRYGKMLGDRMAPPSAINNRLSSATGGVFSVGNSGVQVDRSKIPGALFNRAKDWIGTHGNMLKGIGFGAAALGLGALAFSGRGNNQKQVAAPAGQQAAPFNGVEGNTFAKYQEV